MSSFAAVLRHELRRAKRDRALPWLILLFTASSGYAAWNGGSWAAQRRNAVDAIAQQAVKARDEAQSRNAEGERRNPGIHLGLGSLALGFWYHPTLPARPFTPLSIGQADGYPYDAKFHGLTNANRIFDALGVSIANPSADAAGPFDVAFVIVFLLPLFLLAATYDLWAQERDLGTSGFLLSQPVRPGRVLAAKTLARGGYMLAILTFVLLLVLASVTGAQGFEAWAFGAAAAVVVLYGCFWVSVAVAVNVFTARSTEAALACGAIWLAVVVFLPALLSAGTDMVRPAPSHVEQVGALRVIELEVQRQAQERREAARSELLATTADPRELGLRVEIARVEAAQHDYAPVVDAFQAQQTGRRRLSQALRFLSPAVATQDALDRIAGTDADRALAFQQQVREFLDELRRFATRRHIEEPLLALEDRYRRLPVFRFREPASSARNGPLVADLATLLAFGIMPLVAIRHGLRRELLSHSGKD